MKTATGWIEIFNIQCPHCDASLEGDNGSYSLCIATNYNPPKDGIETCRECGRKFRLPARIAI